MTRERIHNTVHTLSYQPCPYCQGKGKVRSPITIGIYALKELRKFMKGKSLKQVNLTLNPAVIDEILKDKANLRYLEGKYKTKLNFISNPALHIEDVRIS